jgi:hypothetical protein
LGTVTYAYETVPLGQKGSGDFTLPQYGGYHEFGTGGSAPPLEGAYMVLKVQWGGNEEVLELKPGGHPVSP